MRVLGIDLFSLASAVAINPEPDALVAWPSGGRVLRHADPVDLAARVAEAGVRAQDVRMPDWRLGEYVAIGSRPQIVLMRKLRQAR